LLLSHLTCAATAGNQSSGALWNVTTKKIIRREAPFDDVNKVPLVGPSSLKFTVGLYKLNQVDP
jgi:hypothetical protein